MEKEYYFIGHKPGEERNTWIAFMSPEHNKKSTVRYESDTHEPTFVEGYPPRLFNNFSEYVYSYPFYYGLKGTMMYLIMFDQPGSIRFSHSPSGGGTLGKGFAHAWDFHYLIYNYKVGERYSFKARLVYKPFVSRDDVINEYEKWSGEKVLF